MVFKPTLRIGLITDEFPSDEGGVGDFSLRLAEVLATTSKLSSVSFAKRDTQHVMHSPFIASSLLGIKAAGRRSCGWPWSSGHPEPPVSSHRPRDVPRHPFFSLGLQHDSRWLSPFTNCGSRTYVCAPTYRGRVSFWWETTARLPGPRAGDGRCPSGGTSVGSVGWGEHVRGAAARYAIAGLSSPTALERPSPASPPVGRHVGSLHRFFGWIAVFLGRRIPEK